MKKILLLCCILLLSSCGNQTIKRDIRDYPGQQQAELAYKSGDFAQAALLYSNLYTQYKEVEFLLWSADSYLQNQQYVEAQNQISRIGLTDDPLHLLILTELELNINNANQASYYFNLIPELTTGPLQPRYLLDQSRILHLQGDHLNAGMALVKLNELQTEEKYANQIIYLLSLIPPDQMSELLFDPDWSNLQLGWLEAAYVSMDMNRESILQWKQRWGEHPALEYFLTHSNYKNIAVLLPLSGRYQTIAKTIQQGMLAGLDSIDDPEMTLRFYDTGSDGESFASAWYGAMESGAEFVIGPLEKKSLAQLQTLNSSTLPVLTLNQLDAESNDLGLYQFPLLPEDEARSIAHRLISEGKRRVLLLAPDTDSGKELAEAFQGQFNKDYGRVMDYALYQPIANDFSNELKSLLGLLESRARIRRLQSLIGLELKAEPQIRPDIDAIVLFANARLARLIKPQLKFFKAEDVPVYSTSQVYTGQLDPVLDKDLNGIRFSQSHFVTQSEAFDELLGFDTEALDLNKKFFAFGYDAIALSSKVEWMQRNPYRQYLGLSGQLSLDSKGVIHRDLSWAIFRSGVPQYLQAVIPETEIEVMDEYPEEVEDSTE